MATASGKPKVRVVLIDDYHDGLQALSGLCRALGCDVETCADAHAAVETVVRFRPDLVLLDIAMPGKDGVEIATELLRDGVSCHLVALSGYADRPTQDRCRAAGFHQVLAKPIDLPDLQALIAAIDAAR